jgi:hypothetical protein
MNKLEIKLGDSKNEFKKHFKEIKFFIDGENLIDILKKIEKPFAEKEGHPELSGKYSGLDLDLIKNPKDYFLGKSDAVYGETGDKTILLDCTCGSLGCWAFVAKIQETQNMIIWSSFEQTHRKGELTNIIWNYDELSSFEFDKEQYLNELEKLKT